MGFGSSGQSSVNQSTGSSQSSNQAYSGLNTALTPQVNTGVQANKSLSDMLGLNGSGAQTDGFNNYLNSSNYNFVKNQGLAGITGSNAAQSTLGSGAYGKSLVDYNNNLANGYLQQYMSSLSGLGSQGVQAGGVISSAGGQSASNSQSNGNSNGSSANFSLG